MLSLSPQKKSLEPSKPEEQQQLFLLLHAVAHEQDLEKALQSLRKFQQTITHSPKRENYNREAPYRVLGNRLFTNAMQMFPDCLFSVEEYTFKTPFKSSSPLHILKPARYFEDALEEMLLLWEEELDEKELLASVKRKIKVQARKKASEAYQQAIFEVAGYIFQGCPRKEISLEKSLRDYEKIKYLYAINLLEHPLPKINVGTPGGNFAEQNLDATLYRAAIDQTKKKLNYLLSLPLERFCTDDALRETERSLDALEKYSRKIFFSPEEQRDLQQQHTQQQEKYAQRFLEAEKMICTKQDLLYEQWEASVSQGFLQEGEKALKLLAAFTKPYSVMLEETEEEVILRCRRRFELLRKTA